MRYSACLISLMLLAGLFPFRRASGAGTFISEELSSLNAILRPTNVTVGPDDQYRASVDPSGETIVFTRKSDLAPHLCREDLKSGEVSDLLSPSADSQEAAISPEGILAFTYFKYTARGDICYMPLSKKSSGSQTSENEKFPCLKAGEGERSSPFWKSAHELGYVLRDMKSQTAKIIVEDLKTGGRQVLAEGKIWSPAMAPGGRFLFYNELLNSTAGAIGTRALVLKNLETAQTRVLRLRIPGISGFPSVTEDERYLVFSHYLNDTNHDNIIDGNDNSIIFRADIDDLLKNPTTFPEQLTSAESNCSLAQAFHNQLYATCAFEGSLRIYRIPISGIVPAKWGEDLLRNAHETSRSYADRVLILNTMKFRSSQTDERKLDEKILGAHLLAGDTSAAQYYVHSLQSGSKAAGQAFYELIDLYLQGLQSKKLQPSQEELTPSFKSEVLAIDGKMERVRGNARLKNILRGLLRSFINQPAQSLTFLKRVEFRDLASPLEWYFFFELADWAIQKTKDTTGLTPYYRQMVKAPELSEESQLYYAFHFLQHLSKTMPRKERIAAIHRFNHDLPTWVSALLESESSALELIETPDDKRKNERYNQLDKMMMATRSDYFLRKALYVRSILNFAEADEFKYLDFVAANWLRYTDKLDTEFSYARDVFVNASLDRAYDSYGHKQYQLASDYFFGSLSMTDDLESHYGYVRSMVLLGRRNRIEPLYQDLQKRKMIGDNLKFVEALLRLVDASPRGETISDLDFVIDRLNDMSEAREAPSRHLLLGYCYLKKLFSQANGYDFDRVFFENAHRNLMLAYELDRDNVRVKASALMNLGILHQRVQNHGLAVQFFSKRKPFGFTSELEAAQFGWYYARSLFYVGQPGKAAAMLAEVGFSAGLPPVYRAPILERYAFYLQASGAFEKAISTYEELFHENLVTGGQDLAKAYLAYGYCLFELKRETGARAALARSIDLASHLGVIPKGGNRLLDFEPVRLKLVAYGLLGQVGVTEARIAALEKRAELLDQANKKALYDGTPSWMIQNRLQLAKLFWSRDKMGAAAQMEEALRLSEQLGDSGQYLSHAIFQTAVCYLELAILDPVLFKKGQFGRIAKIVDKTLLTYASQKQKQPVLDYQRSKIQILWAAFSAKRLESGLPPSKLAKFADPNAAHAKELRTLAQALEGGD